MNNPLFTPITIGKMEIPNRFVPSATNAYMADKEGFVTKRQLGLYSALAEGGTGLIITGLLCVHLSGKSGPGQTGINTADHVSGLQRLADAVHTGRSKIVGQIAHGGRQARPKQCGGETIAPSAVEDTKTGIIPREMTPEEIRQTIQWFAEAAVRCKKAGLDAVQLHAAHGYLLSQFISPHTNRRIDEWGGSPDNRCRILLEIVRGIRDSCGPDFPVLAKMNVCDFLPKGISLEDSIYTARALDDAGIDAIEISGGMVEAEGTPMARTGIDSPEKEGYFLPFAEKIKPVLSCPLILVGGLRSMQVMEEAVSSGRTDMVSLCRPFIREPNLVERFRSGAAQTAGCISCNRCFNPRGISCPHVSTSDVKR